jgi:hypothetical protein
MIEKILINIFRDFISWYIIKLVLRSIYNSRKENEIFYYKRFTNILYVF